LRRPARRRSYAAGGDEEVGEVSSASRERLARLVREPGCDLAEAALLLCVEHDPGLDVELALLRIDALADGLRSAGFVPTGDAAADARAVARYLADTQGFAGDVDSYHDPRNGLLSEVLDRKRGLPIILSVLYVALARRLRVPAFGIALPGHFVAGVAANDERAVVVVDPFADGRLLSLEEVAARVRAATGGQVAFSRSMLRPAAPADVVRRILANLTRDFTAAGDLQDALWTAELALLLPGSQPEDHRVHGELLRSAGRFLAAAEAFEAYVELAPAAPDRDEVRHAAIAVRARCN
jgi:regulator of sirC expression with transglutaminase-like and TPR domain